MKRIVFLCLTILLLGGHVFAVEEIVLKESDSIDFLAKMEQQEVFLKYISDLDIDEDSNFYFLVHEEGTVFRIDGRSGKLLNTISSFGQGPAELNIPCSIRVMNKMVFIPDTGFGGVKIFSIEGKLVKEFRTEHSIGWLDVNKRNEIFVREADTDGTPIISIYNMKGELIRKLIRMQVKDMKNKMEYIFTRNFLFRLDKKEDLVVLFLDKKILRKYNSSGNLLWERKVDNKIIDSYPHKKPRYGQGGTVYCSTSVFYLEIDRDNNTIVGHVGGAMVFNKDGEFIRLIKTDPPLNMDEFRLYNNDEQLLHLIVGGMKIHILNYRKGGK